LEKPPARPGDVGGGSWNGIGQNCLGHEKFFKQGVEKEGTRLKEKKKRREEGLKNKRNVKSRRPEGWKMGGAVTTKVNTSPSDSTSSKISNVPLRFGVSAGENGGQLGKETENAKNTPNTKKNARVQKRKRTKEKDVIRFSSWDKGRERKNRAGWPREKMKNGSPNV